MSRSPRSSFHLPVLAIIGVGMIGGSLGLGLKKRRLVGRVLGVGRSRTNLDRALKLGAIDEIAESARDAAAEADLVLLATPVGSMTTLLEEIRPVLADHAVVTDVGSVKHGVVDQARTALGDGISRFVPAHPIAGKENSGVAAADPDLYINHKVALTPLVETDSNALELVAAMWRALGADIVTMGVAEHDRVLAMTSHLPHVLAYAMVHLFDAGRDREKCYEMAAGGFYDFTRIASSDPVMWRDICQMNQQQVLAHIHDFQEKLGQIGRLLENGSSSEIEKLFADARAARAVVTERRKKNSPDDDLAPRNQRVRQQVNR